MKNPIKKIKEKEDITLQQFAIISDVSSSTIYKLVEGSTIKISSKVLQACKELGYDPEEIKREYREFRKDKKQKILNQ